MESGGSSSGSGGSHQGEREEYKNKKQCVLTEEELNDKRLENVKPASWDDSWIITLNITANALEDEAAEVLSGFETDGPKSEDETDEEKKEKKKKEKEEKASKKN